MKLNTEEYIFLTNDTGTTTEHHKCENQEFQPNRMADQNQPNSAV